jgi:hypothetical protein
MNTLVASRFWARPAQAALADKVQIETRTARRIIVEPKLAGATSELVLGPFGYVNCRARRWSSSRSPNGNARVCFA